MCYAIITYIRCNLIIISTHADNMCSYTYTSQCGFNFFPRQIMISKVACFFLLTPTLNYTCVLFVIHLLDFCTFVRAIHSPVHAFVFMLQCGTTLVCMQRTHKEGILTQCNHLKKILQTFCWMFYSDSSKFLFTQMSSKCYLYS